MTQINITHDGSFDIAVGRTRKEVSWKNKVMLWSEFVQRLSETHRTAENYQEYCAAKKTRQDEIKDVGGFVGGLLSGGRRKAGSVLYRQLITLDIDHAAPGVWGDFAMVYSNAAVCYSTHKHNPDSPRLRLILPLDREVGPDEYQAIARRIAGNLGIENFDHTTFEPSRLMYWPSTSKDAEYAFDYQDGPWINADEILAAYHNWRDSSEWPVSERYHSIIQNAIKKQGDPIEKPGVVGAFCRTYSIEEAIELFLPDVYSACDTEGRYTYREGSTSGGLVIYEEKYTFSHHGTDPTSMKLCNAFDLVRIHKFHLKDEDAREGTPGNKLPSYTAMVELASKDPKVRKLLGVERFAEANVDFTENWEDGSPVEAEYTEWLAELDTNRKGVPDNTVFNASVILRKDPTFKNLIAYDDFDKAEVFLRKPHHREWSYQSRRLVDADESAIWSYMEKVHNISSLPKIKAALKQVSRENSIHPVREYLGKLEWDGKARLDTLLVEYLGVADSLYTRAVTRKALTACVARVMAPGIKFDYVLTFVGKQGLKKSMLIDKLGGKWFTDSFYTVQGKEAYEQLQGVWLVEIAELSAMNRQTIESTKHFVTKREDRFRVAYGSRSENFPRQCVFFASTNNLTFLRDKTGNRRWWPAIVHNQQPTKDISHDLTNTERDQIWAEAVHNYNAGELLYLSKDLEAIANAIQEGHTEADERVGLIQQYLDKMLPENWSEMSIYERRAYLAGDELQAEGAVPRTRVCVAEICCEVLGFQQKELNTNGTKDIHEIMQNLKGWERAKSNLQFSGYGSQRGYIRIKTDTILNKYRVRETGEKD